MEFYSATKKNEILSLTGKRMELENIILKMKLAILRRLKLHVLSQMWNTDLIQIEQYYKTLVTLRADHKRGVGQKKETKK
jgi:hypothetical protein